MARARLGFALSDVRGAMDGQVVVKTRAGLAVRGMPKYKYPKTPEVMEGAERLRMATAVWKGMDLAQSMAWREYAETISKVEPVTLTRYSPTAKNAFIGLATKFLQINPDGEVPVWPPAADFLGDDLVVKVLGPSVLGSSVGDSGEIGGRAEVLGSSVLGSSVDSFADLHPPTPSSSTFAELGPRGRGAGSGDVVFQASAPNTPGVAVEILIQKLLNVHRSPTKFYKSLLFHTFLPDELDLTVALEPGYYAFAYRFVRRSTGQMTGLLKLPIIQVA